MVVVEVDGTGAGEHKAVRPPAAAALVPTHVTATREDLAKLVARVTELQRGLSARTTVTQEALRQQVATLLGTVRSLSQRVDTMMVARSS